MKKLLSLVFVLCLFSCGASKNVRMKEKVLKGNWTLTDITYSKTGDYNVTLFKDASKDCFEGSSWKFVPNNNTGTYNIQQSGCLIGPREFVFVIQEVDEVTGYYDFLLKPKKNNDANVGYRIELVQLNETSMLWQQNITVNGTPFLINMNFTKQ